MQKPLFIIRKRSVQALTQEIESIGFNASAEAIQQNDDRIEKLFAICLFTIPLFAHMFLAHDHFLQNPLHKLSFAYLFMLLGLCIGKSALNLKSWYPEYGCTDNMGTTAAFAYSLTGAPVLKDPRGAIFAFRNHATIITLNL